MAARGGRCLLTRWAAGQLAGGCKDKTKEKKQGGYRLEPTMQEGVPAGRVTGGQEAENKGRP